MAGIHVDGSSKGKQCECEWDVVVELTGDVHAHYLLSRCSQMIAMHANHSAYDITHTTASNLIYVLATIAFVLPELGCLDKLGAPPRSKA